MTEFGRVNKKTTEIDREVDRYFMPSKLHRFYKYTNVLAAVETK